MFSARRSFAGCRETEYEDEVFRNRRGSVVLLAVYTVAAKQLGSFKDWSANAEGKGKSLTCWIYSEPVKDEGKYTNRGQSIRW